MYTWKLPCDRLGILSISSILPQILPQTSSQTQGNSRVSRMEHQTPSFSLEISGNAKCWGPSAFLFVFRKTVEPKQICDEERSERGIFNVLSLSMYVALTYILPVS